LLIPYSIILPWGLTCISSSRCSSWYMVARDFCRHFAQQINWIGGSAGAYVIAQFGWSNGVLLLAMVGALKIISICLPYLLVHWCVFILP
jgi:hypothetical protein